jgi:hypothetical protein
VVSESLDFTPGLFRFSAFCRYFKSAPGRIRTSDSRFRNPTGPSARLRMRAINPRFMGTLECTRPHPVALVGRGRAGKKTGGSHSLIAAASTSRTLYRFLPATLWAGISPEATSL